MPSPQPLSELERRLLQVPEPGASTVPRVGFLKSPIEDTPSDTTRGTVGFPLGPA
jgi:hypothetical protein